MCSKKSRPAAIAAKAEPTPPVPITKIFMAAECNGCDTPVVGRTRKIGPRTWRSYDGTMKRWRR